MKQTTKNKKKKKKKFEHAFSNQLNKENGGGTSPRPLATDTKSLGTNKDLVIEFRRDVFLQHQLHFVQCIAQDLKICFNCFLFCLFFLSTSSKLLY